MFFFQVFVNRVYDRREKERNEALAQVEAMLLEDGRPTERVVEEVQRAVDRGFDLNSKHFDLNEVWK